jgi:hypothetical protein
MEERGEHSAPELLRLLQEDGVLVFAAAQVVRAEQSPEHADGRLEQVHEAVLVQAQARPDPFAGLGEL